MDTKKVTSLGRPAGAEIYNAGALELLKRSKAVSGLSYAELAGRVGVSRKTIIDVFAGRNRSPGTIRRVADVLGISFALLLN
ncbi:MAG TPA: helix-turn-helix transcriptional regulator [Elusimicrobiales bacterium]|nr:helix-turn-helix transcriptional regulator [Elusimicrobiales bacterium]